ncbi:DNA replication and repair protein RadC [Natranaerovirga hydrolytica]|uniref:DNA replication and repair protein RadC n=1 Tax=Natranaerovirga hydrolytica TaxID=680378 RepID=A0A4R1MY81_9FIRM|nr:DNA repair protein RadC [Natranaerovirga hydrolytica]TCK98085.1 DNA replication and repair protein RadC [Natranaerovirga hydrolytica]
MGVNRLTVKELPLSERPYEKCEKFGAEILTDAELLAVIIRSGSREERSIDLAHKVLNMDRYKKGLINLHHLTIKDLTKVNGIGRVKAIQIKCIAELAKRMSKLRSIEKFNINSPSAVASCYMEDMRYLTQEHLKIIMLDTKNNIINDKVITKGTVNASLITPREVFIESIKNEAVNIILLHNHPSGDPTPSKEDILITKRIFKSGELLEVQLLDHIIIGDGQYVSFKEKGLL